MNTTKQPADMIRNTLAALLCSALLIACSDDTDYDFEAWSEYREEQFQATQPVQALFSPSEGVVPFPSNILPFDAETGTLNLPVDDPDDPTDPTNALNRLDGFSTVAPITTATSRALNPASLVLGQSVRVFEVETIQRAAVSNVVRELGATDITVQPTASGLALVPLTPLQPATGYLVVLTNDIQGVDGSNLVSSLSFRLASGEQELTGEVAALEPWRQATLSMLAAAAGQGVDADKIVLSWTFTTQSTREVLQAVKDAAIARPLVAAPTGLDTAQANEALQGKADVFAGTLQVPYYLDAASPDDPASVGTALNSVWQTEAGGDVTGASPLPAATSTETIPVLMTVPNAQSASGGTMPGNGWPIAIFQHAITGDRTNLLAIADALADVGYAAIAIDLPMHGLIDPESPLNAANTAFPDDVERLFDIDLVDNDDTTIATPDGLPDPSGVHYLNLRNLANARDNLRQASADLFTLSASLAGLQNEAGVRLDASRQHYIGMSLGGIVGGTFLAFADDTVRAGTLNVPGGGIAGLLAGSPTYGPIIAAGLAPQGIAPGSPEYLQFLLAAQTLLDSGDPINHAGSLGERATPLLMQMVRGDNSVPNRVEGFPLSGTEPLARALGLQQTNNSQNGGGLVIFSAGEHTSLLRPTASLDVTREMQFQVAGFAASDGAQLLIDNPDVIEAPAP